MEVLRRFVIVILWGFMLLIVGIISSQRYITTNEIIIAFAIVGGVGLFLHMIVNWIFAGSKKTNETKGRSDPDL